MFEADGFDMDMDGDLEEAEDAAALQAVDAGVAAAAAAAAAGSAGAGHLLKETTARDLRLQQRKVFNLKRKFADLTAQIEGAVCEVRQQQQQHSTSSSRG
jgi:predicted  nucleic acid-binding Zn-ribbon protein